MYFLYVFFIPLYFSSTCFGCYCTHPQEHKLQLTAIGVCNGFGMLIQYLLKSIYLLLLI
jgi:hypothetical protein